VADNASERERVADWIARRPDLCGLVMHYMQVAGLLPTEEPQ
jgi:hypothetical protein